MIVHQKILIGAASAIVLLYNLFLYQTNPGFGTALFFLLLNIFFFLSRSLGNGNLTFALVNSALAVVFAVLFAWRGSEVNQLTNFFSASFLSLTALYLYKLPERFSLTVPSYLILPIKTIKGCFEAISRFFKQETLSPEKVNRNINPSLIRGALIALPLLLVFFFLFMGADPIFGKLASGFLENISGRALSSIFLFFLLIAFGFLKGYLPKQKTGGLVVAPEKAQELVVVGGAILTLFAVFIVVQFRYLFSSVGERELHELGINSLTYSEYIRKGFFELLMVAALASAVILYIQRYTHELKNKSKLLLQLISASLTVSTGLILLSAVKRTTLYIDAHGLTRSRAFGAIFLLWLGLLLAIFLFHNFRPLKRGQLFITTFLFTFIVLLVSNVVNIDDLIARKYPPTVNKEVDYYYITRLSTDSAAGWPAVIADSEQEITRMLQLKNISSEEHRKLFYMGQSLQRLSGKATYLRDKYDSENELWQRYEKFGGIPLWVKEMRNWQSMNLSEYQAYLLIKKEDRLFSKIPEFEKGIGELIGRVPTNFRPELKLDRSVKPPLVR